MTEPGREVPSLGGVVGNWVQSHCAIPDGARMGEPYLLTGEMWDFLLHFYRLDERGRFAHRRGGLLVRSQKWGKGPFAASIIAAEAAGPTRFAGWDSRTGEPIGVSAPTPWIQVAAVSEGQTDNVWRALLPMLQLGNIAHEIDDVGLTRVNLPGGGRIEPVTAAHRSRVGQRTTFAVLDELGFWTSGNHGHELADAMSRNLAGMGGRFLGTTNAWAVDEESVGQRIAGEDGVHVDDVEPGAFSIANKQERHKALRRVYGDSAAGCAAQGNATGQIDPWIDLDAIDAQVASLLGRDEPQARRFFFNEKRAADAAAFNVQRFAELANRDYQPEHRGLIVVGVDGARFDDALAVVATEVETGFQWPLAIQTRPENAPDEYEHDLDAVDGAVVEAFRCYQVFRAYCDPHWIDALLERWQARWGTRTVLPWYTNRPRQIAHAVRRYADAIAAGDLSHDGDETLTQHVANAVRRPVNVRDDDGRPMWTLGKDGRHSRRKIDGAMAAVLSWEARGDAKREGARPFGRAKWQ